MHKLRDEGYHVIYVVFTVSARVVCFGASIKPAFLGQRMSIPSYEQPNVTCRLP
jgi:hypothetical protein